MGAGHAGGPGRPGEHHARLRETLRAFLQCEGSYKATAEQMRLHKNTVQYRIRKAKQILGRPLGEDYLSLELALLASHLLGSAVLPPAQAPAAGWSQRG